MLAHKKPFEPVPRICSNLVKSHSWDLRPALNSTSLLDLNFLRLRRRSVCLLPPALSLAKNLLLSFGAGSHWCLMWWESTVALCLLSLYHLLFNLESLKQYYLDWNSTARQQGASRLQEGHVPSAEGSSVNGSICSPKCLRAPSPAQGSEPHLRHPCQNPLIPLPCSQPRGAAPPTLLGCFIVQRPGD